MINKTFLFISLICLATEFVNVRSATDENIRQNKRLSLFGFGSSRPKLPDHPGLNVFAQDDRYKNNNDLLQILSLFTSRKSVDGIINELWHNAPSVESCVVCNILIKHMIFEYRNEEEAMRTFFFRICELIQVNGEDNGEFCYGFTSIYAPQLFYILNNTSLNSEEVCATLLTECLDHFHWFVSPLFWEVKISEKLDYIPTGTTNKIKEYMTPRNEANETSIGDQTDKRTAILATQPLVATQPLLVTQPLVAVQPILAAQPAVAKNYLTSYPYSNPNELFEGAKFLHLTDLHLDLLYSLHSTGYCGRILCCRQETNFQPPQPAGPLEAQKKLRTVYDPTGSYQANLFNLNQTYVESNILKKQAGYWGSYGNCNLPLRTIKHMFHHLSKFVDQIDYVVFTGDSVSHNIWSTNRQQVIQTNAILTRLIHKYLLSPKNAIKTDAYGRKISYQPKRLVPAIGNHESDVVSMFPSTILENSQFSISWLYRELYQQWKAFIPLDQVSNFLRGGYYSVVISKNMKLIVLNTNTCYRLNFWTLVFNHDSDGQLTWLEQELYYAEKLNQYVHLIGHIAPDKKNCNAIWLHNFIQIVSRYQNIIKAQFYGHSHLDEVKIYYGGSVRRMVNTREIVESMHNEEHNEQSIETLLNELTNQSSVNETNVENNSKRTKRIVNTVAEQQIKQLMNLDSLQKQLEHLNKDLIFKNQVTLTDKINGIFDNPYPGYVKEVKKPISIAFLSPSATTYDDVNPAYKVYIIDDTGCVANAKTFYADIEEGNRNHYANYLKPPIAPVIPTVPIATLPIPTLPIPTLPIATLPIPTIPLASHQLLPTNLNLKRNISFEDLDSEDYEYDDETELDESENKVSYSYAIPDKKLSYNYNSNYASPKGAIGNDYSTQNLAYTHYSQQGQQPTAVSYQPIQSNYQNKQTVNQKTKEYAESSSDYNTKASQSSYGQSTKSNSKNYQLEQQPPLHHPVYEKLSVQPTFLKKYSTYQNSYQSSPIQTDSYQLAGQKLSKSTGQYTQSNYSVHNSQPKLNYTVNSAKPYQQPSAYNTKPKSNPNNLNSNPKTTTSNYQNDPHSQTKPNYAPNQPQYQLKANSTYSSSKNTNYQSVVPNYQSNYHEQYKMQQYAQSSIDKHQPKQGLPVDINYGLKQHDEANQFKSNKPAVATQNNNYQPIKTENKQQTATYVNKPEYQPNSYSSKKASNYPAPNVQNYQTPMVQNYSKPIATKPVEYKPANYPTLPANHYQSYSNSYNPTQKSTYPYAEKPVTNYQPTPPPPKSNYEASKPIEVSKYNPAASYPTPKPNKVESAPIYTNGKYPETKPQPNYIPPSKPNYANLTNLYAPKAAPNHNPKYQPIDKGPKVEFEFVKYDSANEYTKKHPIPGLQMGPVPVQPAINYRPPPNRYPQPYQQYPGKEYGLIYENELGNRLPNNGQIYPTERDYRIMKLKKEHNEMKWRFEYDLNSEYSIARSTPYDWVNFINLLRTNSALFGRYYSNLHRRSGAERWKIDCNEMCRQHLLDEIIIIDPLDF